MNNYVKKQLHSGILYFWDETGPRNRDPEAADWTDRGGGIPTCGGGIPIPPPPDPQIEMHPIVICGCPFGMDCGIMVGERRTFEL